jgi:DNA uptake protein ComE-like DNA-binding protein
MMTRWCPRTVLVLVGVFLIVGSGSARGAAPAPAQSTRAAAGMTKVDLNTATQQELQSLRGIGPATARRIIRNRPYAATAELSRAEVAGPIIDLISPRVTVGPAPAPTTGR